MAMRIADSGVGLTLPSDSFTPQAFADAVLQILDPKAGFLHTAQELRQWLLSSPAGLGRTHGADIIEDVLRRGYKYIVPQEVLTQPTWARVGLDILFLDFIAIAGSLWVTTMTLRTVWWAVRRVAALSTRRWTKHGSFKRD